MRTSRVEGLAGLELAVRDRRMDLLAGSSPPRTAPCSGTRQRRPCPPHVEHDRKGESIYDDIKNLLKDLKQIKVGSLGEGGGRLPLEVPSLQRAAEQDEQGEQKEVLTGHHKRGAPLILRTPWWINLVALAIAIAPCLVFDLPWYVAAVAALITGTIADRTGAAVEYRYRL